MARNAINPEFKQLQAKYEVSSAYFHKLRIQAFETGKGMEGLIELLEEFAVRKEAKRLKKLEPKKKRAPVKTSVDDFQGYKIEVPDHLMSRDEFYYFIQQHVKKSVYFLRSKFYTLKQNNIDSEDLISEIMIKCIRPTREGITMYDQYLEDPNIVVGPNSTVRAFINKICRNHFADYLKGSKWTTPITSLDATLPGQEDLTLGDSIGTLDIDDISIKELIDKCSKIEISKRKNSSTVMLNEVLEQMILGIPLTTVCHDLKVSSKVVQKRFLEAGIEEILGCAVSQERKDKILGNY